MSSYATDCLSDYVAITAHLVADPNHAKSQGVIVPHQPQVTLPILKQTVDVVSGRKRNRHGRRKRGIRKEPEIGRKGAMIPKKKGTKTGEGVRAERLLVGARPLKSHRDLKKRKTNGSRNLLRKHLSYPSNPRAEQKSPSRPFMPSTLMIPTTTLALNHCKSSSLKKWTNVLTVEPSFEVKVVQWQPSLQMTQNHVSRAVEKSVSRQMKLLSTRMWGMSCLDRGIDV
jgi:hypothetical protein